MSIDDAIHVPVDEPEAEVPKRGRKPRTTAVNTAAWEQTSQLVLVILTAVIAWQLDKGYLVMQPQELAAISSPLGRILSRQKFAKAGGKYLLDMQDYLLLAFAGLQYVDRITTQQKAEQHARSQQAHTSFGQSTSGNGNIPFTSAKPDDRLKPTKQTGNQPLEPIIGKISIPDDFWTTE